MRPELVYVPAEVYFMNLKDVLGHEIRLPRPLRSVWGWLIGSVVILLGLMSWSIPAWLANEAAEDRTARAEEMRLLRAYAADHRERVARLWATPYYTQPTSGGTDAAGILNRLIPWEPKPPSREMAVVAIRSGDWSMLEEPAGGRRALALSREESAAFEAPWDAGVPSVVLAMKASWMDELSSARHWNLYVDSPATNSPEIFIRAPDYQTLLRWSSAALEQGLVSGTSESASRRVRSLAWLLLTTHEDRGVATGLALLRREAQRLSGVAGYMPLGPASPADAAKAIAYETSLALECRRGCGDLQRTRLPGVLECATEHDSRWSQALDDWYRGRAPETLPTGSPCHFGDIAHLHRRLAERAAGVDRLPHVQFATMDIRLPSRLELGGFFLKLLLPEMAIRHRASPIHLRSAKLALERRDTPLR